MSRGADRERLETLASEISAGLARRTVPVGAIADPPRYTLFHAANSICSQKARAVLAHHRCGYLSQQMDIAAGDTYLPSYVRLRLIGCDRAGLSLVAAHTGSTAASRFGCDPAVVPALIDHALDEVIIDSKIICRHVDATIAQGERLWPMELADEIGAEIDLVDDLPNYQMLVGALGEDDRRPNSLRARDGANFSMSKVARCDDLIKAHAAEPELVAAFAAKRTKELQAAQTLFTREAVQRAHDVAGAACARLDARLPRTSDWLFGARPTMADLFWIVALLRFENLGASAFWAEGRLPSVQRFLDAGKRLPAIRSAILEWPGALW